MLNEIPSTTPIEECRVLQKLVSELPWDGVIVELGTGMGRTACAMGLACAGSFRKVFSIDNWSESARYQDWLWAEHPEFNRVPWTIETAGRFVAGLGLENIVTLIDGNSSDTSLVPGPVDMVWVDAGHTYEAVRADILAWEPRAKKIVCGHDYDIPDVARAVNQLLQVRAEGRIWICERL